MKCEEVRGLLSDYCDGALTLGVKESVKLHLGKCKACRKDLDLISRTIKELNGLPDERVPENFYSGLDRKISAAETPLFSRLSAVFNLRNAAVLLSGMLVGVIIGVGLVNLTQKPVHGTVNVAIRQPENKVVVATKDIQLANNKIEKIRKKYDQASLVPVTVNNTGSQNRSQLNQIMPKKYIVVLDESNYNNFIHDLNDVGAVQNSVPFGQNTVFSNASNVKQTRIELELEEDK